VDKELARQNQTEQRDKLRRAYFMHDLNGVVAVIDGIDATNIPRPVNEPPPTTHPVWAR
jgi:hypothetical protein